jgi:hypothetical protein
MPRNDLLEQSAPRAELDQRSREARLRLERVEQLLAVRSLPRPSLLRRVLRRLGPRIYRGQQIGDRSAGPAGTGGRARRARRMRGEAGGAAGGFPAICHPVLYHHIPKCERLYASQGLRIGQSSCPVPSCVMVLGTNLGTKRYPPS